MTGALKITLPDSPEKQLALAISRNHYLEFGNGAEKGDDAPAGRIGYQTWTSGLDIVGANSPSPDKAKQKDDYKSRKITLHSQGGVTVFGPILMDGFLGQYDGNKKEAPEANVQARVREFLKGAAAGAFIFYLANRGADARIAWKDVDDKVYRYVFGGSKQAL
jgi:hypothetical protein